MKFKLAVFAATVLCSLAAQATLVQGAPTPTGESGEPSPRFGTLIDFDDAKSGSVLASDHYKDQGVSSITNEFGPALRFHDSSQSGGNYIGTGLFSGWTADILVGFEALQSSVGIGIAGPTTLFFQLLDADQSLLEGYSITTTASNSYYVIDRDLSDVSYMRLTGVFVAVDDLQFSSKAITAVPEPGTYALMLAGLGVTGCLARRRKLAERR